MNSNLRRRADLAVGPRFGAAKGGALAAQGAPGRGTYPVFKVGVKDSKQLQK